MRINTAAGATHLMQENANLQDNMSLAESQILTMQDIDMGQLSGEAYKAIRENLVRRTQILKVHILVYEAIWRANNNNISKLRALPHSTPGILDREYCQEKIDAAHWEIKNCRADISTIEGNYYSCHKTYPTTSVNAIKYDISAYERTIKDWQAKINAAEAYDSQSAGLYTEAQDLVSGILAQCTDSVQGRLNRGFYLAPALGWTSGLDDMYKDVYIRHKIDMARTYMTDEELAAYILALGRDGVISAEDIYGQCEFNEVLYSGLAKLPQSCIADAEAAAVGEAYESMSLWGDTKSMERLFELSYVIIPELKDYSKNIYENIRVPGEPLLPIESTSWISTLGGFLVPCQATPLLGRAYKTVADDLKKLDVGALGYKYLLAGADLLKQVSEDGRQIYGYMEVNSDQENIYHGVDFALNIDFAQVAVAETDENGKPTTEMIDINAAVSTLATVPPVDPLLIQDLLSDGSPAYATAFVGITGDYSSIGILIDKALANSIPEGEGYTWTDAFVTGATLGVGVFSAGTSIALTVLEEWVSAAATNEAADALNKSREANQKSDFCILSNGANNFPSVMASTSYGFNYTVDADSMGNADPRNYLSPQVNVFRTNDVEKQMNEFLHYYNSDPNNQKAPLTLEEFDRQMTTQPAQSLLINGSNDANSFLNWCDKQDADLVYKEDVAIGGKVVHSAGEKVSTGGLTNSDYIKHKDDYSNYQFNPNPRTP
ncbi:MAG: hypothetical protein LBH87_03615 [Coriobacteriales bacterium]|jgi:hypothetical protein|nr:hypothetical protein [Coriobacteriales bacterium]